MDVARGEAPEASRAGKQLTLDNRMLRRNTRRRSDHSHHFFFML